MPDSVAAPSTWTRPMTIRRTLIDTEGHPVPAIQAKYETPNGEIMVWWVGGYVVSIDPAPNQRDTPALYDDGLATAEGEVRMNGAPSCRWKPLGSAGA